jgi:hypothetical protein
VVGFLKTIIISAAIIGCGALIFAPSAHALSNYTWTNTSSLAGNSATSGLLWRAMAASSDGQHIVAVDEPSFFSFPQTGGAIWISEDAGTTWTNVSLLPANSGTLDLQWTGVASSADGQKLAAVASGGGVWTSDDGGQAWDYVANFTMSGGSWQSVTMSADGQYLTAMPYNGDVWSSNDGGATWINNTWITGNGATHQDWQSVTSSADGQTIIGGVSGGSIWISKDGGQTWTDNSSLLANTAMGGLTWKSLDVSANGQIIIAAATNNNIWTSHNGGATWTNTSTLSGNSSMNGLQWNAVTISADGQNMAASVDGGDIWVSRDAGVTWASATPSGAVHNAPWTALASDITGGRLIAGTGDFSTGGDIFSGVDTGIAQVTTTTNTTSGGSVTALLPSNTTITCSSTVTEASLAKQDAAYTYPFGLLKLCYTTVLQSDQITLTFVTDLTPSQVIARDFNTATNTWTTIPGAVITQTTSGGRPALQLVYTVADNGPLDSNAAVNFVTDPVGLAVLGATTTSTTVNPPATGSGQPTKTNSVVTVLAAAATTITGVGIVLLPKRRC